MRGERFRAACEQLVRMTTVSTANASLGGDIVADARLRPAGERVLLRGYRPASSGMDGASGGEAVEKRLPELPEHRAAPDREPTLAQLSARALEGDHGAFEQIHRRVGAGVKRLLLRRSGGREDLVEEISQRTWTSVWQAVKAGKYDPSRSAITTFVYAVANNAWLTHLRGFARDRGYIEGAPGILPVEAAERLEGDAGETASAVAASEELEAMRSCLAEDSPAGLSDLERTIVRAIAAGETDRGLARRLKLSSSTVNVRKHAAYEKIRVYMASRGFGTNEGGPDANNRSAGRPAARGTGAAGSAP